MMRGKGSLMLAVGLGALALIRPLMNMLGLLEKIGQPSASIAVTLLISAVWIGFAVMFRVENPFKTLLYAGIAYGVFAIVISAVMSPILEGQLQGPITNPYAIIGVLLTNALWGAITGSIAAALQKKPVKR